MVLIKNTYKEMGAQRVGTSGCEWPWLVVNGYSWWRQQGFVNCDSCHVQKSLSEVDPWVRGAELKQPITNGQHRAPKVWPVRLRAPDLEGHAPGSTAGLHLAPAKMQSGRRGQPASCRHRGAPGWGRGWGISTCYAFEGAAKHAAVGCSSRQSWFTGQAWNASQCVVQSTR